jgi:putative ABC transport system permease protein
MRKLDPEAWASDIRRILSPLALDPVREAEIAQELAQHLQDRYSELRRAGASEETARRDALSELDQRNLVNELTVVERQAAEPLALGSSGRGGLIGGALQDLRFGARLLVKDRGATAVVVSTLALGIAANAIVFGFTDLLLLRPLPIGNAARIAMVYGVDPRQGMNRARVSVPDLREIRDGTRSFEDVAASWGSRMSLTGAGEPRAVNVSFVTANLPRVWDVPVVRGRAFLPGEDAADRPGVAILSHRFWTSQWARDEAVLGRPITLNGKSYTVVGVFTPAIELGNIGAIDIWVPFNANDPAASRGTRGVTVFGLLRPGATLGPLNAELTTIADRLQREYPTTNAGWRLRAISMREATVGANTWIFLALLGVIVTLVLLVACANVATVMLARASARRREIAVRLALGATRPRLARQLVSEGLLLGLAGGGVGLVLTYFGLRGFERLSEESYFQRLEINGNLLIFTLALSLLAPVLFGLIPALQSSRPNLNEDLKEGSRDGSSSRGGRTRSALVVVQVAFALSLLIVAGLVVRAVNHIQRVPLGITTDGVLATHVRLDPPKYGDDGARLRALAAILERLRALPGVTAAAAMTALPVADSEPPRQFVVVGRPAPSPAEVPWAVEAATTVAYDRTFGIPLVAGRFWTEADRPESTPVAIVSRDAARRYWADRSPLGDRIQILDGSGRPSGRALEIVGVVDDVKGASLAEPPPPRLYRPLAQAASESVALALRGPDDPAALAGPVREALRAVDADLAVSEIEAMAVLVRSGMRNMDLVLGLFVSFGLVALLLAAAGVYGVTSFSVGQRQHEIGIRVALGATAQNVVRMIMAASLRLIVIGVALGVAGGMAIGRMMGSVLFGVSATDAPTYLAVTGLLAVCGFVASYLPAHHALSIDPVSVLKRE